MQIEHIAEQNRAAQAALRSLNNEYATETSFLSAKQWRGLIDNAFVATCVRGSASLLVTFDQDAAYDSPNFRWFCERIPRFVYIDRIIISTAYRGDGLARHMYCDLFQRMKNAKHSIAACEVNVFPPNPASDAFHSRMGFSEVGRARLQNSEKVVRYLSKQLN